MFFDSIAFEIVLPYLEAESFPARPLTSSRKRTRDQLPKWITEILKRGDKLIKAAKGLDD